LRPRPPRRSIAADERNLLAAWKGFGDEMKFSRSFTAAVGAVFCSSCATSYVWRKTDPNEYLFVERTPAHEAYFQQHKIPYLVDYKGRTLYVDKNKLQKLKDYSIRTLAIPVTVVLDTATTVVVVGGLLYLGGGREVSLTSTNLPSRVDNYPPLESK
jgi:hypothetical protein